MSTLQSKPNSYTKKIGLLGPAVAVAAVLILAVVVIARAGGDDDAGAPKAAARAAAVDTPPAKPEAPPAALAPVVDREKELAKKAAELEREVRKWKSRASALERRVAALRKTHKESEQEKAALAEQLAKLLPKPRGAPTSYEDLLRRYKSER